MPRLAASVGNTLTVDPLFLPPTKVVSPRTGGSSGVIIKNYNFNVGMGWESCKHDAICIDAYQVSQSTTNPSLTLDKLALTSADEDTHSDSSRNGLSIESNQSSSPPRLPCRGKGVHPTKVAYDQTISCSDNPEDILDVFSIGLENVQCDEGTCSTAAQHTSKESIADDISPVSSEYRVPFIPPCETLIKFLQTYHNLVHCLIRVSRKSSFVSRNPDIRFVAISIMQQYLTSGRHTNPRIGGVRHQGVLVATCILLGGKYCDQDTYLPNILSETELDKTATVNVADVMEMEITVLKAIDFKISVSLVWEALSHLAIKMPTSTDTLDASNGSYNRCDRLQYEEYTPATRQRVIFAGLYADRVLYELSRNERFAREVIDSGADELAFGASIATAAGLSLPVASVTHMFRPFFLMFGISSKHIHLPVEVANLYCDCLKSLGSVISKTLNERKNSDRNRIKHR